MTKTNKNVLVDTSIGIKTVYARLVAPNFERRSVRNVAFATS